MLGSTASAWIRKKAKDPDTFAYTQAPFHTHIWARRRLAAARRSDFFCASGFSASNFLSQIDPHFSMSEQNSKNELSVEISKNFVGYA